MGRVAIIGRSLSSEAPRTWAMLRFPEMKGPCLTCHNVLHCGWRHCHRSDMPPFAKRRLDRTAASGCFQVIAHGIVDSLQCNGRTKSRIAAFLETQHLLPISACHPCVHQTRTLSTVHQWPAKISAAVSLSMLGGRMKAGSKMTGARLGKCFGNGPQRRSRHRRILEIAYASRMRFLNFFCVAKHAKRPKRWPPAVCFTVVQCSLAHLWQ